MEDNPAHTPITEGELLLDSELLDCLSEEDFWLLPFPLLPPTSPWSPEPLLVLPSSPEPLLVPSSTLFSASSSKIFSRRFPPTQFSSSSQRRRSLSLPVLTLIFPALLPCLVRDSLCTALQTKILWINWSLNAIDTIETWVSGNLTALTERSQPAIRWRVGEVANRVSCGSFPGGH